MVGAGGGKYEFRDLSRNAPVTCPGNQLGTLPPPLALPAPAPPSLSPLKIRATCALQQDRSTRGGVAGVGAGGGEKEFRDLSGAWFLTCPGEGTLRPPPAHALAVCPPALPHIFPMHVGLGGRAVVAAGAHRVTPV